jgi:tetratricopeptide (TPR) repeat protein
MQTRIALLLTLSLSAFVPLCAQISIDDQYKLERAKAMQLFNTDKYLEALPLFEDLAKRQPEDPDVLVGLAAGLIDHSATVEDQDSAAKERVRARGLLLKAQQLGSNSTFVQNLLQITPENGVVPYQTDEAGKAMRAGEAAFARRDFDEAIRNYSRVLDVQPTNYSAALFIADSYFSARKFDLAKEWYEKAAKIDPNRETAYRYEADMLTKNGEMETARTMAIEAIVAEPYNPITWRGLTEWARANKLDLVRVHINVPAAPSSTGDGQVNITFDPTKSAESMAAWLVYSGARINWRKQEFATHFPNEKTYRHSLSEETEALNTAASVFNKVTDKKKKKSELPKDQDLVLLLKLTSAEMLEPYVLLSAADEGISHDYDDYRQKNRAKLVQYLSEFIVPAAPKP